MAPFIRKYEAETYASMRIIVGVLFMCHGAAKLFGFPQDPPEAPAFIIYIAGSIEFFGGLLVAIGLFTSWAAFLSSGLMAAAYWIAHGTGDLFPILNGGELAVLYCFVFLYIAAHGPGKWSIDQARA
ncbi:MAG: DoxX family protein, partial [Myxococcota bacterium]